MYSVVKGRPPRRLCHDLDPFTVSGKHRGLALRRRTWRVLRFLQVETHVPTCGSVWRTIPRSRENQRETNHRAADAKNVEPVHGASPKLPCNEKAKRNTRTPTAASSLAPLASRYSRPAESGGRIRVGLQRRQGDREIQIGAEDRAGVVSSSRPTGTSPVRPTVSAITASPARTQNTSIGQRESDRTVSKRIRKSSVVNAESPTRRSKGWPVEHDPAARAAAAGESGERRTARTDTRTTTFARPLADSSSSHARTSGRREVALEDLASSIGPGPAMASNRRGGNSSSTAVDRAGRPVVSDHPRRNGEVMDGRHRIAEGTRSRQTSRCVEPITARSQVALGRCRYVASSPISGRRGRTVKMSTAVTHGLVFTFTTASEYCERRSHSTVWPKLRVLHYVDRYAPLAPCTRARDSRRGRYLGTRSSMYEYFTVSERSVRSGRSKRSYNPRVSV